MWIYYLMMSTVGVFCRLVWIGKVEGIRNVPRSGRVIIAPNHQSWLDFCFLAAVLPRRLYFLIAGMMYKHPLASFALRQMKHIRVDLDDEGKKRLYKEAQDILMKERALVVFPEGWMTFDGKVRKAYLGVARMALSAQCDIIPTVIESYHIYPRHYKRPRFLAGRCRIKFLPALRYDVFRGLTPEEIVHFMLMPVIAEELGHVYDATAEGSTK